MATLLLGHPALALAHGELVASLPFQDPSLDRLRRELLNLAAAGSSLEKPAVLTHFIHQGMAELLTRLGVSPNPQDPEDGPAMKPKPVLCAPQANCGKWNGSRNGRGNFSVLGQRPTKRSG